MRTMFSHEALLGAKTDIASSWITSPHSLITPHTHTQHVLQVVALWSQPTKKRGSRVIKLIEYTSSGAHKMIGSMESP